MHICDLQKVMIDDPIFEINNNSKRNIVLFGNCHVSVIGFYLNEILGKKYNIAIIFSSLRNIWKPYTDAEKQKVWTKIEKSHYFVYQEHKEDYNINASSITKYANYFKILIPNLQLIFTDEYGKEIEDEQLQNDFNKSFQLCKQKIEKTKFKNFMFILENYKKIRFFTIPRHPTNYVLYLLSLQIANRIIGTNYVITLSEYHKHKNDKIFLESETVILGDIFPYKSEQCQLLGIDYNSEFYDKKCK